MMDRPNRVMPECRSPSRLTSRLLASIEGQCHVHEAEEYSDQVSEGSGLVLVRWMCTHYHALGKNRRWTRMLVLIDGCQDATGIGAD